MTGFLRGLRSLILGETWLLPVLVAVVVAAAVVLHTVVPAFWRDAGGPLLGVAVAAVLVATVARTARR